MAVHIEFGVEVTELADGWQVKVDAGFPGAYGVAMADDLHRALGMAVAYMEARCVPDLLTQAQLGLAPDGPKDMG